MAIINLRDFYPYYTADSFIEVPEKAAEAMAEFDRKEEAFQDMITHIIVWIEIVHITKVQQDKYRWNVY